MARFCLFISLVLLPFFAIAQKAAPKPVKEYAAIDKAALALPAAQGITTQAVADYINVHFSSATDKARAVFIWTATNISYDVDNMFAINFYESKQDKIGKALKTGKGICENYAAVFTDVAIKCGISAYVIEGYTKQNGFTDYIPHAWCAAMIDGTWYLFDPTWGSGYISNSKFVKKINNDYFKVLPATIIKSHMPFDPMWEFLNYTVTNQDFYEGKTRQDQSKPYFDYVDSIAVYEKMGEQDQLIAATRRVEGNGVKNALVYDRLNHLKQNIEINNQNKTVSDYNFAVADYNDGINLFNVFINYYNNQFRPAKTDVEIRQMIDTANTRLAAAKKHLANVHHAEGATIAMITSLQTSIAEAQTHVDEQEEFVTKYLAKSKMGRKLMFHRYTWMGMPVN